MYGITLAVTACLRSGTRADVAWLVESDGLPIADWSDAVMLTPGGGRVGSLAGGALDGKLTDLAGRWNAGRLVDIEVTEVDALIAGLPSAGSARCLLVPADELPGDLWDLMVARQSVCLVFKMEGDEVVETSLYTADTIGEAGEAVVQLFETGSSGSAMIDNQVVTVFRPVPQLVVVGDTPVADALTELAALIGWRTRILTDLASATGVIATLSKLDKVVVTVHDLDLAGAALMAALESDAGYIGALGARRMQENRADWLAYRGVTDLTRVHGPAGIDIGAETAAEIAVSILAEAIAEGVADGAGAVE
ncbi:MAG TPA: XdhC family protein [Acidimicrobiia bacterium]|nr:XdhC family protein [Acidimicrobiia bacterium]